MRTQSIHDVLNVRPELNSRFWSRVDKSGECWTFTGGRDGAGYGMMSIYGHGASPEKAHRISFVLAGGTLPPRAEVCHKCDNPACVRPDHLFAGSHHENMIDASKKGRMKVASKGKSGSANNMAKLTEKDIPLIRELRKQGKSQRQIGLLFGVDRSTISQIDRHIHWK